MAASEHLLSRFSDPRDKEKRVHPFCLEIIHDFYKNFHSKWDSSSAKLLEVGDGPVIYPLASASPHFSEITYADSLQSSLDEVQVWLDDVPSANNWMEHIRYFTCDLEFKRDCSGHCGDGKECDEYVFARQADIRSKVKTLCKCDVHADEVLSVPPSQFDVVSANFYLELMADTVEDFRGNLKKLSALVKPGGFFISLTSLQGSYRMVEGARRTCVYLERADVEDAFKSANLEVVHVADFTIPEACQNVLDDCKALVFIAGQKK